MITMQPYSFEMYKVERVENHKQKTGRSRYVGGAQVGKVDYTAVNVSSTAKLCP